MKINITMKDELIKRVEEYADENYISKSGTIAMAVNQFLNAQEMSKHIRIMAMAMKKISETNQLDDEIIQQLQDFERFAKVLTGSR